MKTVLNSVNCVNTDMRFVRNFTPPDFQAKNFTPLFSPNFNSFGDKNTKKISENGNIYTAGKNLSAVTGVTNSTSVPERKRFFFY